MDGNDNTKRKSAAAAAAAAPPESASALAAAASASGDSLDSRASLHDTVGASTKANFLNVDIGNKDAFMNSYKAKQRSKNSQREGRRNSVLKSLMVLDIDDQDEDYKAENNYERPQPQRRYMRRGSVTKHKLTPEVNGMQPTKWEGAASGDESDYGSDYDSGCEYDSSFGRRQDETSTRPQQQQQQQQNRRYLRRGSVTKYSLENVSKRGMQPTNVAENNHNFVSDTQRLPPVPSNDFSPDKVYLKKEISARRLNIPNDDDDIEETTGTMELNDHNNKKKHSRSSSSRRSSSISNHSDNGDNFSNNLDDTGRRCRTVAPLPGDDNWSGNLDDSGHIRDIVPRKKSSSSSSSRRAEKHKNEKSSKPKKSNSTGGIRKSSSRNRKSVLATQNSMQDDNDDAPPSSSVSRSFHRKESDSSLEDDSDSEFASEDVATSKESKTTTTSSITTKFKRIPRLPPSLASPPKTPKTKGKHRPFRSKSSPLSRGLQTIDYEKDAKSISTASTVLSSSSWHDDNSVASASTAASNSGNNHMKRPFKSCLKSPDSKQSAKYTSATATAPPPLNVKFGRVNIFEFPIILGDNPAVTSGAPVTIDWKPQAESQYSIQAYEQSRCKQRRRRRKLLISVSNRAILLLAAGYSIDEIADASIQVQQIKSGRQESLQNQSWDRVNLLMEHSVGMVQNTGNAVTGVVHSTGKKLKALVVKPLQQTETARMA